MWFIVMIASVGNHPLPTANIADFSFKSYVSCMEDAAVRARAFASAGAHGKFICMRHGQSEASLRKYPVAYF